MHEVTLTGTLSTLLIVLLLVVLTLYLSQWGLYLLQKLLEVARLLIKVVALLVVVVAVLAGGRYLWDWFKSPRTCTGAFFEKVIPCKPLDLTPKAASPSSEVKNALSVKKDRNAVKPSVKEKSRKTCKDKKEQKAHPKYHCVLQKES